MADKVSIDSCLEKIRKSRKFITLGSPLWAYKVTDAEFQELQYALVRIISERTLNRVLKLYWHAFSKAFVLYAATWLQRNSQGRPKWEPLLSVIKASDLTNTDRIELVNNGLRQWGCCVHNTGNSARYLDSLASQGGFPRSDLLQQSESHIMEYFESVLSKFERYQHSDSLVNIAVESLSHLPITLQQITFADLVTQLIDCLLDWKSHYNLGLYSDPVKVLDNEHPTWRDELPFLVLDEEARTLINKLLNRASKFRRRELNPIRVKRKLIPVGEDYRLVADVYISKEIHPDDLNRQLADMQLPSMFLLSTKTCDGNRFRTASFTLRNGANGGWQVSSYQTSINNSVAAGDLIFSIDSDGRHLLEDTYYKGESLNDKTPWIFEPNGTVLNCIGQGSIKTRSDRLIVVSSVEPREVNPNACVKSEGKLIGTDLCVYEVSGHVRVEGMTGDYFISCSSGENERFKITIETPEFTEVSANYPVYKGLPTINFSQLDDSKPIPQSELFWHQKGSGETFQLSDPSSSIGRGVLVWKKENVVLWEFVCILLPEDFEYRLAPVDGSKFKLTIRDVRLPMIGMLPGFENWLEHAPVQINDETHLILEPKNPGAENVGIAIKWNEDLATESEFTLPISFNIAAITDRKGAYYHELERGKLTLNDLANLQVMIRTESEIQFVQLAINLYGPADVDGRENFLMADQRSVKVKCSNGVSLIPGTELSRLAGKLFSLTDKLDSYLRVEFFAGGVQINSTVPKIKRYKHDLQFVDNRAAFTISPTPTLQYSDSPILYLSPIWDLEQEPLELSPVDINASTWRFELPAPKDIDYGAWLIWAESSLSVHPRIKEYAIPFNEQPPSALGDLGSKLLNALSENNSEANIYEEKLNPNSLQYKVKYLDPRDNESLASLNKSIRNMGFDIDHPGWCYIDGVMEHIDSIEPLSLYAMTSMQRNLRALVVLLFRYKDRFNEGWELAERLGVSWYSIEPRVWIDVIKQYYDKFKRDAEPLREISVDAYWDFVFRRFLPFEAKGPYFKYLAYLATDRPAFEPVAIWDDPLLKAEGLDDQTVGAFFKQERKFLMDRHEGKLLSRVGTRRTTENFLDALEQFWPTSDLPPELYGFIKFTETETAKYRTKQDAWTITMAVPLKLGFCLSKYYQMPRYKRVAIQLSQVISRIDEFDREWFQNALIVSHMACEILSLDESDNNSVKYPEGTL